MQIRIDFSISFAFLYFSGWMKSESNIEFLAGFIYLLLGILAIFDFAGHFSKSTKVSSKKSDPNVNNRIAVRHAKLQNAYLQTMELSAGDFGLVYQKSKNLPPQQAALNGKNSKRTWANSTPSWVDTTSALRNGATSWRFWT